MRTIHLSFLSCLLLALAWAGPGRAAPPAPAAPPLDGFWKGPLKLPGGQLEVIFRLTQLSSGEYFATLDVPLQKVSRLAVTVVTRADTVRMTSAEANSQYVGQLSADGTQLQGTWQQPGLRVPMTLTRTAPPPAPAARPRLTPPYREEEVGFQNTQAQLPLGGTLTVPAGPGPFPTVALLADAGQQERNATVGGFSPLGQLADYLTRRGVAVLRFGSPSGAAPRTTEERVADAQAALNYLRTRPEVDLAHLGLVGHGEGGNVALLAATQPLPPAFVACLAPYGLPGSTVALQQQETLLRSLQTPADQITAALKRQGSMFEIINQTINNSQAQAIIANMLRQNNSALDQATAQSSAAEMVAPTYRFFLKFDPVATLPLVACPVLLLYGSADTSVNPDNNLAALTKALKANKAVTTRKLPGVNHLFQADPSQWPIVGGEAQPVFAPAAADAIRAWVVAQAGK